MSLCPALSGGKCAVLLIKPDETLFFVGKIRLVLLHGSVSIMGTIIKPGFFVHNVFAPRTHSLPPITGRELEERTSNFSDMFPARILHYLDPVHSVLALGSDTSGIDLLSRLSSSYDVLFKVDHSNTESILAGFYPLQWIPSNVNILRFPSSWTNALRAAADWDFSSTAQLDLVARPFVGLVKGGKGVGKSTFARMLLNTLLTRNERVAFLDCDIGQSEFTPGGLVGIHVLDHPIFGPPFTHQSWPYKAHFIGSYSPGQHPSHYISCIADLLEAYRLDIQFYEKDEEMHSVPLVVNTQGWIRGLGGELSSQIESMASPSHCFDFEGGEDVAMTRTPGWSSRSSSSRSHTLWLAPQRRPNSRYTSADLRNLSVMSYLHFSPLRKPLCAMPPWEINTVVAYDSIRLLGNGGEDVETGVISDALRGGLVGLIVDSASEALPRKGDLSIPYERSVSFPSPSTSRCLGLGVVRWISGDARTLHMVTPLPGKDLASCRCIVKGDMELPLWAFLPYAVDDLDSKSDLESQFVNAPFLVWGTTSSTGAGEGIWKRRSVLRRNLRVTNKG
ncbi:uncharacterized protein EI90DRAFT_2914069 [Cantharellus anzutake]|uniref:uncharacterized protein n=1 Tax=Cantharellus anzutake TaxID=1750568 RepID=UPI0019047782|nr:uncharacterized protein EI90DRAFT_2914069 [Cantharellus anzutake]KAF8335030.1 hypothetical protein EI90DRAFT_2914069 [Cantharellus anzutake]